MFNGSMDTFQEGYDFAERLTDLGWEILKIVRAKDTKTRYYLLKRPKLEPDKDKRHNSLYLQEIYYGEDGRKELYEEDRLQKLASDNEDFYKGVIRYINDKGLFISQKESDISKYEDKVDISALMKL